MYHYRRYRLRQLNLSLHFHRQQCGHRHRRHFDGFLRNDILCHHHYLEMDLLVVYFLNRQHLTLQMVDLNLRRRLSLLL